MLHQLLKTFAKHDFHVSNKVRVYFVRVIRHPFPFVQILEALANIYLKSNSRKKKLGLFTYSNENFLIELRIYRPNFPGWNCNVLAFKLLCPPWHIKKVSRQNVFAIFGHFWETPENLIRNKEISSFAKINPAKFFWKIDLRKLTLQKT